MVEVAEIQRLIEGHHLVRKVDKVPKGHVRLETAFTYPDGGSVDVFVVEESNLQSPGFRARRLSDLGATTEWLLDVQVKPWLSPKRKAMLEDAIRIYGVTQEGGALEVRLASMDELLDKVVHLGQACLRVADLTYTRRSSLQAPILDEIVDVLVDAEVRYEVNAELMGRFGKPVRVDVLTEGEHTKSAILTLASANVSASHNTANEILRRWYDLTTADRSEQKITVYDDRKEVYRDEDLKRLETLSAVVPLSDPQMIADLVAA